MVREGLLTPRADGIWQLSEEVPITDDEPRMINADSGKEWLVASNPRLYDAQSAFDALPEIDWSETDAGIVVGDLVYLYGSSPISAITHQCLVVATGVAAADLVPDEAFWVDAEALAARQRRSWMRLRLLHTFDEQERSRLSLEALKKTGLASAPQSRMRVPLELSNLLSEVLAERDAQGSDDQSAESAEFDPALVGSFRLSIATGEYSVPDLFTMSKARGSAQRAFAERVKRNYGYRCAITGVSSREFLVASHIVPWGVDESIRLDPRNGICLSTLVDRAFDTGYLAIDVDSTVFIDLARLEKDPAMQSLLAPLHGAKLSTPMADPPNPEHLRRRLSHEW